MRINHKTKVILITLFCILTFGIFIGILGYKLSMPFQVSIYNYESYINKNIERKLKKNYSYHVFTEINEFTKAINSQKAVAGVGSDHQIAQLITEGKIQKIDFSIIYPDLFKDLNTKYETVLDYDCVEDKDNSEKTNKYKEYLKNKKQIIYNLYPSFVREHLDKYNEWLKDTVNQTNKKIIKSPLGKVIYNLDLDEFYEYNVPYFVQDKMITYNVNKTFKNHLNISSNIEDNYDAFEFPKSGTIIENNKVVKYSTWLDILTTLNQKYNYKIFNWTNSFLDNTMIGETIDKDYWYDEKNKTWKNLDFSNYRKAVDDFMKIVQKATGHSIRDIQYNKLITNGLELVNSIIEPSKIKGDVSIMYNGDTLDSYYAEDNFASLGEIRQINYIRPKNNYLLMDAWIISHDVEKKSAEKLLKILKDDLFEGQDYSVEKLNKTYIEYIKNNLDENKKLQLDELILKAQKIGLDSIQKLIQNPTKGFTSFYKENKDIFVDAMEFVPIISNFDAVNYTVPYQNLIEWLKDWYFLTINNQDNIEKDEAALNIFNISNVDKNGEIIYHRIYQPLPLKLKTLLTEYYFRETKS
ncbi:hypothetical protein FJO69_01090 [[Mycoplasma] falconis]|uniref:Spermidine/putrescine ABC transporter substrate-binding protein n=1 Tax=[Mycoplasma] falconis TaxID=92403 RepID=A0A501XBH1_9BACT|nr:hypothetical protein [[Mycoplasma] falconis]TPE57779.1 hypothetical protein FJO69_01090 [[Mycoplasma] falconis]